MNTVKLILGDVRDGLATIPDDSIDLVMTSPPFLALRSYLPADHPDKDREIGSEPDPATFLDTLLALTAEWRRVLAPHGSIAVELGDTYSGSGGGGGDYAENGLRAGQDPYNGSGWHRLGKRAEQDDQPPNYRKSGTVSASGSARTGEWPLPKSLCGIPHLYHLSLAYGRNLLTGEPSPAGRWLVRNVVAWCRPNPPVGALGDKYRPATTYMTIATPNPKRYFDLDAVRTPHKADPTKYTGNGYTKGNPSGDGEDNAMPGNPAGAPPLDYWVIPTAPYRGSHYATFPPALVEKPIQSMVPQRVCRTCGEPSRRITAPSEVYAEKLGGRIAARSGKAKASGLRGSTQPPGDHIESADRTTVGWTDCGHGSYACASCGVLVPSDYALRRPGEGQGSQAPVGQLAEGYVCPCGGREIKYVANHWRTGVVLDPFAGSGTTLMVASGHGRDSIGIDIDERNADLVQERVGMWPVEVIHLDSVSRP